MFFALLYATAALLLLLSWQKNKMKTKMALKKAWASCLNVLPLFLGILLCMGLILSFAGDDLIQRLVGKESGFIGLVFSGIIGSIALIPAFAAYPAAAGLLNITGGYAQVTMLITTLMLVGVATIPLESKIFGMKATLLRNGLGLVYSLFLSVVIGMIFGGI